MEPSLSSRSRNQFRLQLHQPFTRVYGKKGVGDPPLGELELRFTTELVHVLLVPDR